MKRPATLKEAREIVQRAKVEQSTGSNTAHRWHLGPVYNDNGSHGRMASCRASVWMDNGRDVAVVSGVNQNARLTIIGNIFFATTVFVGQDILRFINCRGDTMGHMHDMYASRLEYGLVPRNGHSVWQVQKPV